MSRWIVASLLVVAVAAAAWTILRAPHPARGLTAPSRTGGADDTPGATFGEESAGASRSPAEETARTALEGPPEPAPDRLADDTGALAGVVLVEGAPPFEPIRLRLSRGATDRPEWFTTDLVGRFRIESLPSSWSGEIELPLPYRLAALSESKPGALEVPRLTENLVIDVVRTPVLRMRILRDDHSPATNIPVVILKVSPDGMADVYEDTDAQGIAMTDLDSPSPVSVDVLVHLGDGSGIKARFGADRLVPTEPHGDIDLGDLVLIPGRGVRIRCMENDGTPLGNMRVDASHATEAWTLTTDAEGFFEIGLPGTPVDLELEVYGYLASRLTVASGVTAGDVHFSKATLLRVTVVDTRQQPWVQGRLLITTDGPPYGAGRDFPPGNSIRRSTWSSVNWNDLGAYFVHFDLDSTGTVEIPGLVPGLDLELEALDEVGFVGARELLAGLDQAERREVVLHLTHDPCTLEVLVVDATARKIPLAEVTLEQGLGRNSRRTQGQGPILFEGLLARRVGVSAVAEGMTRAWLDDVDPCASPVTVVLQRGRSLEVEVRDESGQPVTAGWLTLYDRSGNRYRRTEDTARFEGLPFEPLQLTWGLNYDSRVISLDAVQESVVLQVPTLGEILIDDAAWARVEGEYLYLRFERTEPDPITFIRYHHQPRPHVVALVPGRHRLQVEVHIDQPGGPPSTRPFGAPLEFLVEPGSKQVIVLAP